MQEFLNVEGLVAIRGAITAENTAESIVSQTQLLMKTLFERNNLVIDDIISVLFSSTADLTKAYPARAAREMGLTKAALFSMSEPQIENSLEKCIRVLVFARKKDCENVKFVYMGGAKVLREDIHD